MKKRITALLIALLFAFGLTTSVDAETASYTSDATVTFEADNTSVTPIDPTEPDKELPGGGGTGMTGTVTLDYVPALPFGLQKITSTRDTYKTTNMKPFIQVTDKSGEYKGYSVTARLGEFIHNDDSTKKFNGLLTFTNGTVVTTPTNTSTHPVTPSTFTLNSTAVAKNVMSAAVGEGRSTFLATWLPEAADEVTNKNSNVKLTVNTEDVFLGGYTGIITWELTFTPTTP